MTFIFWIIAGIFTCRMPMSKKAAIPCCNSADGGCCNNAPDTRTITEEGVHPDGRRTITMTVIPVE